MTRASSVAARLLLAAAVLAALAFIVGWKAWKPGAATAPLARVEASLGLVTGRTGGEKVPYHRPPAAAPDRPRGFCEGCHDPRPHRRKAEVRAMLNYHAGRMHCLVCHGRPFLEPAGGLVRREDRLWPAAGGREASENDMTEWRRRATLKAPCFDAGPGCADCHRPGGLVDFRILGYGEEKAGRLVNLEANILQSVSQKWFYP